MKRHIKAFHLPSLRAERIRAYRYRSSLQDGGVIHIHIVKIGDLPPDAPVGALLPKPAPKPTVTTRCAGDGAAICAQCKRTFFQADGEDCLCHNCWAASLTLGGCTPPWADKEAAGLICSACGYRYVSPETWICGSCGADANEVPWPGGAA